MTVKQKRFCDEYLISGNATDAAIKAGYSPKTAYSIGNENLSKPEIKAYIQAELDKIHSAKIANAAEVQERLTSILRMEVQEEVVVVEGFGDGCSSARIILKRPSNSDAIKAGQTLAKMQGAFDNSFNVNLVVPKFGGEDELED